MIIAIDGPAGSGKSTISKLLSEKLDFFYLDTGAMYRVLTLKALKEKIDLEDLKTLLSLAKNLNFKLEKNKVYLDNEDVTLEIRKPIIDKNISQVCGWPEIREIMVSLQRKLAENKNVVAEGRDMTTVVFPYADFKFYLDADLEVRARRRFQELKEKKIKIDFLQVKKDLKKRDLADKTRKVGALKLSKDAIYIDTTNLTIKEVLEKILNYIKLK